MILLSKKKYTATTCKQISMTKKKITSFLLVLLCISLFSLTYNIIFADDVPVSSISIDVTSLDLQASETYNITATILPSDATNQNIIWSSSDNSIAVVDNGEVTGFSEGTATITATTEDGSFQSTCTVNITPLTAVSTSEIIRIKLSMNNPTTVPFYLDGNYSIEENSSISLPRQFYEVKLEDGVLNLYYGNTVLTSGTTITIKQHSPTENRNNFLWIKNSIYGTRRYLGDMKFTVNNSVINVINYIYLEEYLWGVVPHEMSNSFPIEALKSQAIAARTYAVRNMGGTNYDLIDTSANQVYKGYHPGNAVAISAVDATNKIVLQYSSTSLVPTYYSASNGGYTEIPYHVWGGGYSWPFAIEYDPYDIANPSSAYEEVYFPITIDVDNPVTCSDNVSGTPNISNAILYFKTSIFNTNQLQSQGYDVSSVNDFDLAGLVNIVQHTYDSGISEDHQRTPNTGINNCVDFIMATADFKVNATKDGVTEEILVNGVELDMRYFDGAHDDDTYLVFNMTGLRLTLVEPKYDAGVLSGYSIYQRRYGHGIGMSQRGAQQRANSGQAYQQILSFYYPQSGAAILDIEKDPLTIITPPIDNSNATVLCNDYLSVREEASTSATRIFTLPPNARVQVVQPYYNSTYHMINFGEKNYFIHADYVKIDDPTPVNGVTLDLSETRLEVGNTHMLNATIEPSDATDKGLTWSSSNQNVVTVDNAGTITAVSGGTAIITVTTHDGDFTATCTVTVIKSITGVTLSPYVHKMLIEDTIQLYALTQPEDATNQIITYSSSNSTIASVDSNGLVTANELGNATITVTTDDGGYTAECEISVVKEMITSSTYFVNMDLGYYENVSIGTSVEDIIASVSNSFGQVLVYNNSMKQVIEGNVSTGYYIQLVIDGEVTHSLRILIEGDCSPDTILDIIDYTLIRLHILDVSSLEDIYCEVADVNDDGIIDIIDYTLVRLHILDVQQLY